MRPDSDLQSGKIFPGNSELAKKMRELDWPQTELGPTESWPHNLRTALSICLTSVSPTAVWWGKRLVQFYNDAFIPFLGKDKHPRALGMPAQECWVDIWNSIETLYNEVIRTGFGISSGNLELHLSEQIPGEQTYATFSISPILSEDATTVDGLFVVCTDTTQSVVAEKKARAESGLSLNNLHELNLDHERLRESEKRFSTAFNASPFSVSISSMRTGKLIEVNETFVQLSGYSREEAIGRSTVELGIWVDPELRDRELEKLKHTGRIRNVEYRFRKKTGEELVGMLSAERITLGGEVCVLSVVQDITERKINEEKLNAAQKQLQLITDTMAAAVTRCNQERRYVWVSKGYATLINKKPEEIEGKLLIEVLGIESYETIRPYVDRVLSGEKLEFEALVNYKGVGPRWVNVRYTPIFDRSNTPNGWVSVIDDITKRRELEDALIRADRRKDEFLATLAHELRNPLAPIKNGLEIMRLAKDDLRTIEHSRAIIDRQVQQMVRLIDDLLDLSRVSRGKITLRKETVNLAMAIQNAVESSRPLLQQSNHSLTISIPPDMVYVHGDITRLSQIFSNLLNNAAKYTAPGGKIQITMSNSDTHATVSIKDDGIGINSEMLPHVFEMFTQAARSVKHSHDGLGIGLSIVKRLVEMHKGEVEARSEGDGKGSEFIVRLPVIEVRKDAGLYTGQTKQTGSQTGYKVLVVDDNEDSAISMAKMMELMGNMVRVANNGLSAFEIAEKFRPDFIFLDIGMPEIDGFEVCRRIRKMQWGAEVTIAALTGWGQEEDKRRSSEAGFNHHLVKPIDFTELERILQKR